MFSTSPEDVRGPGDAAHPESASPGRGRPDGAAAASGAAGSSVEGTAASGSPAPGGGPAPADAGDAVHTTCCIVGAGPAGAMLALMLARKGIPTVLLEEHHDLDRDFRGETLQPSTMEVMDDLGLADRLLALPHGKFDAFSLNTPDGVFVSMSFRRLKTKFPYVMLMPQFRFLTFVTTEAAKYPAFRMVMGARADALIEEGGQVRGVRCVRDGTAQEVRALLTVACDGRFSRLRRLAGQEPVKTSPPMDIMWFRVARRPEDDAALGAGLMVGAGGLLVLIDRGDSWQLGYVIRKGGYQAIREAGLDHLRREVASLAPVLGDRLASVTDWQQVAVLSVESNRVPRWHKPGLLLIGDAAHTMSPVGGVGINYAIQDAVVAANELTGPLAAGRVEDSDLARVQAIRERPVRVIQRVQSLLQNRIIAPGLAERASFKPAVPRLVRPLIRLPWVNALMARTIAFGLHHPRVRA